MEYSDISAVICSVGHANDTLVPLVRQLEEEGIWTTVIDNRGTLDPGILPGGATYIYKGDWNVYEGWNFGMELAEEHLSEWCCVLNDDVILAPGAPHLVKTVCADPAIWLAGFDYNGHAQVKVRDVVGSYREHGIGGFAFMAQTGTGLRYDPRFTWWGGDDDLVWSCLARGARAVVVEGANVQHPDGGNTSGRHYPDLLQGVAADRALLMEKWGRAW
jgi:hypothetical protein